MLKFNMQCECVSQKRIENSVLYQNLIQDDSFLDAFYNLSTNSEQQNSFGFISEIQEEQKDKISEEKTKFQFCKVINKKKLMQKTKRRKIKKMKEFHLDEDLRLLESILQYGRQFSRLIKLFPKRTVSMLKNRYYKNLRYRWEELLGISYNEEDQEQNLREYLDEQLDYKSLINMLPETYSCPLIRNMLGRLITRMEDILKFEI